MSRRNTIIQRIKSIRNTKKDKEEEETSEELNKQLFYQTTRCSGTLKSFDDIQSSPTGSINSIGSTDSVSILDYCVKIK